MRQLVNDGKRPSKNSNYQNVYHNTVYVKNTGSGGFAFYVEGGAPVVVKNNLFVTGNYGYAYGSSGGSNITVSDNNFKQEVLEAKLPVLVDFWAAWCAPCTAVAPIIDKIAIEYEGKLKVAKVNTDENPGLPENYGIMSIPTLILFKNGKEVERVTGFNPGLIEGLVKKWVA